MKKILKNISALAFAGSMLVGGIAHAGIVTNGGFESGGFDGWQQFGSLDASFVVAEPDYVHTGDYVAFFGEVGGLGGIVQQLRTTVGQTYSLKFWLGNMGASEFHDDTISYFALSIGGVIQPASLLNSKVASELTAYDVAFFASSALTDVEFAFRQDETFWFLDDVSVSAIDDIAPAPVPEPGTLPLMFAAFAGAMYLRAKRAGLAKDAK